MYTDMCVCVCFICMQTASLSLERADLIHLLTLIFPHAFFAKEICRFIARMWSPNGFQVSSDAYDCDILVVCGGVFLGFQTQPARQLR